MISRTARLAGVCQICQRLGATAPRRQIAAISSLPTRPSIPSSARRYTQEPFGELKEDREGEADEARDHRDDRETPWYLQVEPPKSAEPIDAVTLPEAPDDAPAIMGPLIKYVYEEMGLDDITLLDLRSLDRQPALGPNLIMVFGTARSERHLHVSAGDFVRWLRKKNNVPATAAGLLTSSELKLKLRRLRKKGQLVGATSHGRTGKADGISTDWISVHLGTIGAEKGEVARTDESGMLSGFGTTSPSGTTIVVQAMTEERRAEAKLEELWTQSLERSNKRLARLEEAVASALDSTSEAPDTAAGSLTAAPPLSSNPMAQGQRRAFSSSARFASDAQTLSTGEPARDGIPGDIAETNEAQQHDSGMQDATQPPTKPGPAPSPDEVALHFERHLDKLASSATDRSTYIDFIAAIFHERALDAESITTLVEKTFKAMQDDGMATITTDVVCPVIQHASYAQNINPQAFDTFKRIQTNFETLLFATGLPCPADPELFMMIDGYAATSQWDKVWETMGIPPRFMKPRSTMLYHHMFSRILSSSSERVCATAIRLFLPEMMREGPSFAMPERLFDVVMECIKVADPDLTKNMRRQGGKGREFPNAAKALTDFARNQSGV